VRVAREYHDRTAHSPYSVRASTHSLDWDVKPFPFKVYTDLPPLALSRDIDPLAVDALAALAAGPSGGVERVTLDDLATLLYYAAGVTKKQTYPGGGEVLFRAAPSTGALYQTEVYVAAGRIEGLEPGLYHFSPGDFALRRLRAGDVRARHPYVPLSSSEVDYPLLREIHRASMLHTPDDVRAWREAGRGLGGRPPRPVSPRALVPLPAAREASGRSLGETIQRRGSTRQFGLVPLSAVELATALWSATRSVDADVPTGLVDLYLIVNAVDGVEPGAYHYRPEAHALELLKAGRYRNESAYLCLEQPLGGDAAAVIYFLAPLDRILPAFGNRGYRLANLEAGIAGGRAYLAAYAQGFGASGLTFYDGHVVEFFSPHAAGKDAIFVVALGRAAGSGRVTIGTTPTLSRRPSG